MKKTITRPNRLAAIVLLATLFLLSCSKDNGEYDSKKPYAKLVISYNKYAGDSTHYDSKGRVTEQWVDMPYPTLYEYPSANEVVIKSITRSDGKVNARFIITLVNGKASKTKATYYDVNNAVSKEYTSEFIYDAMNRLVKIKNNYGSNTDIDFIYNGEVVTKVTGSYLNMEFDYDMTAKLPVAVPNMIYGTTWNDYFYLSGLFLNGMMGKLPMYAVKKAHHPNVWQSPVEFDNVFGAANRLLETKLKVWDMQYMHMQMEMRYKTITIVP